jgi:hypothetical protein
MDAPLMGVYNVLRETEKGKLHGRLRSVLSMVPISSFSAVNASFIVSCAPSFVNHMMRFLLRGEGCNTPCYGCTNYHH